MITFNNVILLSGDNCWLDYGGSIPEPLPIGTIRFLFYNDEYDPSIASDAPHQGTWTRVSSSPNVWDYYREGATWYGEGGPFAGSALAGSNGFEIVNGNVYFTSPTSGSRLFINNYSLTRVNYLKHDGNAYGLFGSCTNLEYAFVEFGTECTTIEGGFEGDGNLTEVSIICDGPTVTSVNGMFKSCSALVEPPSFDTTNVSDAGNMFQGCSALKRLYPYNLNNATDVHQMYRDCHNVESGIVDAYNNMNKSAYCWACFRGCGDNTASGAAELAQIPSDWK